MRQMALVARMKLSSNMEASGIELRYKALEPRTSTSELRLQALLTRHEELAERAAIMCLHRH